MAFESPLKFPLVANVQNRDAPLYANQYLPHRDARLVNAYAEKDTQTGDWWVQKRPGLRAAPDIPTLANTAGGIYYWRNAIYEVFGSNLYKNGALLSALAGSGPYYWEEIQSATPLLVLDNGSSMYYTDGTTVTLVTDVDLISPRVPGPKYLDGTLYVANAAGTIQGSNINDPANWSALNIISANSTSGRIVALAKQLSYICALKEFSCEFFYNAGNATGSPLGRVSGALLPYGCTTFGGGAVADMDGILLFPTQNRNGDRRVARLDNLALSLISLPSIDRLMNGEEFSNVFNAFAMRIAGHRFYVLKPQSLQASIVYDLDQNLWYEWQSTATTPWIIDYVTTVTATIATLDVQGLILGQSTLAGGNGVTYAIEPDYQVPNDMGTLTSVDIYTPNFDAGIFPRQKHLPIVYFEADQTPGSILEVRYNDNDFKPDKWTNFREVDLDQELPLLDDEGSFYRRAYNLRHRRNTPFRIKNMWLQMALGTL